MTCITAVMVSMSSAVTCRRFGMPALLISRSIPPKASITSTASWSTALMSARLATHIRLSGEYSMHRPTTSESWSARRAQMPTIAPRSASASARPAPMPDEPPVTSVRHPFRSSAIVHPTFNPLSVLTLGTAGRRLALTFC